MIEAKDKDMYLKKSKMLADVLNEKATKNANVTANFKSLNSLVMIEATKDTMIEPRESEQYGMWQWGTTGKNAPIVALRDSEGYQGDWKPDETRLRHPNNELPCDGKLIERTLLETKW